MAEFFKDLLDFLHPDKGLRLYIVKADVFLDRRSQIRYAGKSSSPDPFPSQFTKPPLDQIQPRRTRGRKMKMEPGVFGQPVLNVGVSMRSVVVQDQMEILVRGSFPIQNFHELQKLLVAVAGIACSDDGPLQNVQGGKEAGRAVPFVVVGHRPATTFFHRQARLGSVQGLNLGFLIHAQNHGLIRGIQVKADHVGQLFDELFVRRQLKRLDAVGLQSVGLPNAGNSRMADSDFFGQSPGAPMRRVSWNRMEGSIDNQLDRLGIGPSGTPTVGGIFGDARRAEFSKSRSPQEDGRTGNSKAFSDGVVGLAFGCRETDARPQNDSLRSRLGANPGFQCLSLLRGHGQNVCWFPHGPSVSQSTLYCKYVTETLH